ncbi:MAG: esterase-like activity of phytase family protein [Kiloniellaceae bacterium]
MRAVLLAALLLLAPFAAVAQDAIALRSTPLTLNPEDRSQTTIGRLSWRGGFALTSEAAGFGGLSDLELAADGRSLIAVTDEGHWLSALLTYDAAGNLAGMAQARLSPLHDTAGRQLPVSIKRRRDAEALTSLPDGSLLIAFERQHRIERFVGGLDAIPEAFPAPPGLAAAPDNAGIEALVTLADGRLLAFTEGQKVGEAIAVYLREADGAWRDLALQPSGLFRPTGAALLPSGDILLLERRFTLLGGLGARISRIALADIRPGAMLVGEEIAELRPPLTVDNFEGVAVHRAADGSTRLTLISDDNFNPWQRNLVVQFELLEK